MLEFREVQNGVELLKNGKSIFEIKVGSRPICVGFGKNEYKRAKKRYNDVVSAQNRQFFRNSHMARF